VNFILDADIKGFFDALDHDLLLRFLKQRVADPRVLRLVQKWLKAGVMENGDVSIAEQGSPQGGSVSPLLANIFLHFVLDVWIHEWRQREAGASVIVVRYADDFVLGFERKADASRCYGLLQNRFAEHKLELHPEKTRLIEFGPYAKRNAKRHGKRTSTFNFLGFTHIVGKKHSNGMFTVYRRTISKRKRQKLREIREELRKRMHHDRYQVGRWLHSVLSGYYRYYGVPGNYESLNSFYRQVLRSWHRVLNRRSGKVTMTWERLLTLANRMLPKPTICHPYPLERMGVTTQGRSRMR
jgi:group II intron reverse transcriptase/maturase